MLRFLPILAALLCAVAIAAQCLAQPPVLRFDAEAAGEQIELQEHLRWRAGLPDRRLYYSDPPAMRRGAPLVWWDDDGVFEPWPVLPGRILDYRYDNPVEQPIGHDITWTGPNSYVYGPVYDRTPLDEPIPDYLPAPSPEERPGRFVEELPLVERPPSEQVRPLDDVGIVDRRLDLAEEFFRAGDYVQTLEELDSLPAGISGHGRAELLRAQAAFALGEYVDAAAALRRAAGRLPPEQWGFFVENHANYYEQPRHYTRQIRRLEDAIDVDPDSTELRLLLGYHYGYLGYPAEAIVELDAALRGAPDDSFATELRELFARQVPPPKRAPEAVEERDMEGGPREF